MEIIKTIGEMRKILQCARAGKKTDLTIGLVPTMGALHAGHYALIERCRQECDYCVISIFINPTQFGPQEDLTRYPRTLAADCEGCEALGVDLVFTPEADEMYPDSERTVWVTVDRLSDHLCGASRPGHFRGVCTVVTKLFNIVQPDKAYFGQKDAQQLAIIRRMTAELDFPIEIVGCPTVRDEDGLALSSRNSYLAQKERLQAVCLYQALQRAGEMIAQGETECPVIIEAMRRLVESYPDCRIDYISIVDNEYLQPLSQVDRSALVALAVFVGQTRLIDNWSFDVR